MKAQVLYGIGNIKYTDVTEPVVSEGMAVVKVSRCGICGSDIPRIYKTGAHNMPLIPGHEFAGIVEKCDSRPELVGKRVGVFPLIPCKKCSQCQEKHYEMCENYNYLGSRCDGGFAQYVAVPLWNLLPVPNEVTDDEAAMLEPMCVAIHAMRGLELLCPAKIPDGMAEQDSHEVQRSAQNVDNPQPFITVCGLGTIGLIIGMLIKDAGYRNVFFIGNKTIQKEMILKMGYAEDAFCDVRYNDPEDFIKEKTDGKGSDYYFECIGRSESYAQAVKLTAPLGKVMLVGNPASDMELPRDIYWKILRNQMTLKGTWNSSYLGDEQCNSQKTDDWNHAVSRLVAWKNENKEISPSMLITHRFKLEDMQEGLRIMHNKAEEYIKIMVEM